MNSPYLLDTQVLIWAFHLPGRLSPKAASILQSGGAAVSAASLWEMMIKKDKPGTPIADPTAWWQRYVTDRSVEVLPIYAHHVAHLATLPRFTATPSIASSSASRYTRVVVSSRSTGRSTAIEALSSQFGGAVATLLFA